MKGWKERLGEVAGGVDREGVKGKERGRRGGRKAGGSLARRETKR